MQYLTRRTILAAAPAALAFTGPFLAARPASAKQYGPGVTDSEIKIGNTGPYSGPLSNASPIPISMAAYFSPLRTDSLPLVSKIYWPQNADDAIMGAP
jgi:hypothetical protein